MKNCSLDQWYQSSMVYDWEGHAIAYKHKKTDQPTLVLIHGFPTASYDWWKVWTPLSNQFSLLAPDMIGFGYSSKPKDFPYSIMKQADMILDLLKGLDLFEFHILAHDYGDTVAQEILARTNNDDRFDVKTVCLLNGGIFPEAHHPLLIQKLLMSPMGFLLSRLLNQRKFEHSFSKIFGSRTKLDEEELSTYWTLVSRDNGHLIAHKIIRYMRERVKNRTRWVGALQHYRGKLGLINGPDDPISGRVMVERFREVVSVENIWKLDNIGHYPQIEAPDRLVESYFQFLT